MTAKQDEHQMRCEMVHLLFQFETGNGGKLNEVCLDDSDRFGAAVERGETGRAVSFRA